MTDQPCVDQKFLDLIDDIQERDIPRTLEIARHILWHYHRVGGTRPTPHDRLLMMLIEEAGPKDQMRLSLAFPVHTLLWVVTRIDPGLDVLAGLVGAVDRGNITIEQFNALTEDLATDMAKDAASPQEA